MKRLTSSLLLSAVLLCAPAVSFADFAVSITIAPPVLPVYEQPPCPADDYIWTPGYWAYGPYGYYWVPGTWVLAPEPGLLWTPGYWGWVDGAYIWNAGYWGPHIGYYGGVNYGYGYGGHGYDGGRWDGGHFHYDRAYSNVNVSNVHNTYITNNVVNNYGGNRVSYNGGVGGTREQPSEQERRFSQERHFQPTGAQLQQEHMASSNRSLLASVNHGSPSIAATPRAASFTGAGVTHAGPAAPAAKLQQRGQFGQQQHPSTGFAPHAVTPQVSRPSFNNQAGQAQRAPTQVQQPHYAVPQAHYQTPQAQQPFHQAPQAHYQAPAASQPHYQAPQAHYSAPAVQQPHFAAPQPQPHFNAPQQQQRPGAPAPQRHEGERH